jgi:hypothetical protein
MTWLWLACTDPDAEPAPPAAPEPPLLDEVLSSRCPDPTPRGVVPPGDDLHKLTLSGEGVCNDGTPAVLYLRAAADPEHQHDWVVFLEGGSCCDNAEDCAIRWCGEDFYDAAYMSSRWHPETRAGIGIGAPLQANTFATWNQVVLAYCSSDRWSGLRSDQVLQAEDGPYRLHFLGHQIVTDALEALSAGPTSDDGQQTLPALTEARTVVLAGSSAGGLGVITHLDRAAEALPGVEVVGVPDALFFADPALLGPEDAQILEQHTRDTDALHRELWAMAGDTSCERDEAEPWRCSNFTNLLRDHVSTPFLLHHDLLDTVIFEANYVPVLTLAEYAQAAVDTFSLWEERGAGSVLLTGCGVHQYVPETRRFLEWTTRDSDGGPPWSLHDALAAWLQGSRPLYVLDDATGAGSSCPGE